MEKTIDERIQEKGFWYDSYGNCCVDYTSVVELIDEQRKIYIEKTSEFLEQNWQKYFISRYEMKVVKGFIRKIMEE